MKRIGMLTSGGDCQALNATMRGVAKGLYNTFEDVEVYGFLEGYKGLIYGNYVKMKPSDFSGILTKGGTILGSSRQPFKLIDEPTPEGLNKVEEMKKNYNKLKLDALVVLGGNGSQKTANRLSQEGLNVIGLPKTIDNDIWGTDMTFGFQSAVDVATQAIDCIHTTACSHNRVFIVEVMGHKVGWITLHAGIASGADIILIPEIPYDIAKVCEALDRRTKQGKGFYVSAAGVADKLSVLVLFDKLSNYKQVLFNSFAEEIGDAAEITIRLHNQNVDLLEYYVEENLDLFERMKNGEFPDGSRTLRAKWEKPDWTPPNPPCSGKAPFQSGNRLWQRACKPGFRMKRRKP